VRYITNHSSGKMGFALAEAAAEAGAKVTLISGPVHLPTPDRVERIDVISARDMLAACEAAMPCDLLIAAAAVADYRPEVVAQHKLKKDPASGDGLLLQMVRNPDILATLAGRSDRPFSVGFAAETENLLEYASRKLKDKNLDLIVANDVANPSIGFNSEENAITIIDRELRQSSFAQTSKGKIARQLIGFIAERLARS
jgi:phosphopantothenoylcysteine decarboxylase/phosphopantothenate--cysteine ligase